MEPLPSMDRRTALKWMLSAAAATTLAPRFSRGQVARRESQGYGTDPDLLKIYKPGELWPLTLTEAQRRTAAALADVIIPADAGSPAASGVGIVDFLDEWISAPYPDQAEDRVIVLPGLAWIEAESVKRFAQSFGDLDHAQKAAICDDICHAAGAKPGYEKAAHFFATFRNLVAGGYYTTPPGRLALGYVGNMPLASFDGPPPEVLRHVGLL